MTTYPLIRDTESVGDHSHNECPKCGEELVLVEPMGVGFGQWWVMECEDCKVRVKGRVE